MKKTMTHTTNTEFCLDMVKNRVLNSVSNLDRCIKFDGVASCDYIFFDEETDKVYEVSFKYESINIHEYNFFDPNFCIMKTKVTNKFLCLNWVVDELVILSHKLYKFGIKDYSLKEIEGALDGGVNIGLIHNLVFANNSDSAAFQLYFQNFFHSYYPSEEIKEIVKENRLLE